MKIEASTSQLALANKLEFMKLEAQQGIESNAIGRTSQVSFSDAMKNSIDGINRQQLHAADLMAAVDAGRSDDMVGAMVTSQKADLSFSALMQVRNKLVTAFDDIMRMPL